MIKNLFLSFVMICFGGVAICNAQSPISINEVMQSNVHGIMDDLNDFPDSWVELYNNSSQPVDLSHYALSVKDKIGKAFRLPKRTLNPGDFILIYCDKAAGKNTDSQNIHTSFRVDAGKGFVYLWQNSQIVQSLELKKMPAPDVSYGRINENTDTWGYQAAPTPGAANCNRLVKDVLPTPEFSREGGLQTSSFQLSLTLPSDAPAQAALHYTLDGSVPTDKSPVYNAPIQIDASTVVRASLFADGYITPLPATQSYIFHPRTQTLPVVSMTGNPEYFYGDKIGILVDGSYSPEQENYKYEWRRPVNIEYFEADGSQVINQVIETRLKGTSSRIYPLKSMVLYANKRFVTKRLEYEFFHEQRPGVTDFKSLEIRNAGQDFHYAYMRDAIEQKLIGEGTQLGFSAYQPVIFYLNGEYKGIINLRERSNEDNVYTNYNGLEDIDMVESWWEIKSGTHEAFDAFKDFYNEPGHTLQEYLVRMETGNFADLMAANAIFCNVDFPRYNIIMWKETKDDAKWDWILKDMDYSFAIWGLSSEFNYLEWLYNTDYSTDMNWGNREAGTILFRRLMEIPEFKNDFFDRMLTAMGDYLSPERVCATISNAAEKIAPEINVHRELYISDSDFDTSIQSMLQWYPKRVNNMYRFASEFLKADAPFACTVSLPKDAAGLQLCMNGRPLITNSFDGQWIPGRDISLRVLNADGTDVAAAWKVTASVNDQERETTYQGGTLSQSFTSVQRVKIEPIIDPASIDGIHNESSTVDVVWYDIQGHGPLHTKPTLPGIYLRKAGNKVTKVHIK